MRRTVGSFLPGVLEMRLSLRFTGWVGVTAKALWDALVGLYGAGNGIAMAGGPAISRIAPVWEKDVGTGDSVYGAREGKGYGGAYGGEGQGKRGCR